jgi:hypothetical protein
MRQSEGRDVSRPSSRSGAAASHFGQAFAAMPEPLTIGSIEMSQHA